jgi:hypothetical protein
MFVAHRRPPVVFIREILDFYVDFDLLKKVFDKTKKVFLC